MEDLRRLESGLFARWPEHRVAPSLARVSALMASLGDPHRAQPAIAVAGTNGKGSTAAMVDALLRASGLRTGRYASPHLSDLTERIVIDGEPIDADRLVRLAEEADWHVSQVDQQRLEGVAMTFFEVMTGLAFAAFADAPVDVAVLEVGLGGRWDATNVADAAVAAICPIDLDHTHILGGSFAEIAAEKAGVIKPGAVAVLAGQPPEAARVLLARCQEVGVAARREGPDFGLIDRQLAVGGQVIRVETADGPLGGLYLPLHGEHMARNAALAVATAEAFLGGKALAPEAVAEALETLSAPGRLELVRTSPAVVVDTAHNPHAVAAALSGAVEAFAFEPLIVVAAMMRDKDAAGVMAELAREATHLVATRASSDRSLSPEELAEVAEPFWPPGMVSSAPDVASAIEAAVALADEAGPAAGVLVVGSVISAGEARRLLVRERERD